MTSAVALYPIALVVLVALLVVVEFRDRLTVRVAVEFAEVPFVPGVISRDKSGRRAFLQSVGVESVLLLRYGIQDRSDSEPVR